MDIDRNQSPLETHRSIFEQVRTLGLKHKFKPLDEFDIMWYREAKEEPFVLFPHPSLDGPDEAIKDCAYPNVWIRHNAKSGDLEYAIAFWSAPSVDQRFANFAQNKNENQKARVLSMLNGLSDDWLFQVYKKKRHGDDEIVYENKCNLMGQEEVMKVISDVSAWRAQWKKDAAERGNWTIPAINFMKGSSSPQDSDQRIKDLFNAFDQIAEMAPSKQIKEDSKAAKKELQAKIDNLSRNLEKSKYKTEIESRLKTLKLELEQI
jgi:hypothetical protein